MERRVRLRFANDREKLAFMRQGAERDAVQTPVVELATRLVRGFPADDWAKQVREIVRFVRDGIRYQHDPARRELLASATTTLNRGVDDCDGKARTAVALARALGIDAQIWPVWRGPVLAHVQSAFRWPGSQRYPGARSDGWVIADTTVKGCELGDNPFDKPRNPTTGGIPLS